MRFAGKVALITGAANGIGAATAEVMARDGAKIFAVDLLDEDLDAMVAQLGDEAYGLAADLADLTTPDAMVEQCFDRFGRIDILVNNAAVTQRGRAGDLDLPAWRRVMGIDLDAIFLACRAALPHLLSSKGCIVNTASVCGVAADYGLAAYNTAKAGVIALTRAIAIDYAASGVRANSVSPGPIANRMAPLMPADLGAAMLQAVPMGRYGKPEEVAELIAFLASPVAGFITGENVTIDGGLLAHTGMPNVNAFAPPKVLNDS